MLLGTEPFRSLAMAVRLVYMNGEPSNFGSVCNQLRQGADPQYHDVIDGMRERYNNVVNSKAIRYDLGNGKMLDARGMFETWLYYGSFHTDLSHKAAYDQLAQSFEPMFSWSVHSTALQMAGCILDLDDLIAIILNEEPLERI